MVWSMERVLIVCSVFSDEFRRSKKSLTSFLYSGGISPASHLSPCAVAQRYRLPSDGMNRDNSVSLTRLTPSLVVVVSKVTIGTILAANCDVSEDLSAS